MTYTYFSFFSQIFGSLGPHLSRTHSATRDRSEYKYLSCVPGVDGKIHPEGVVQHRR